MNKRLSFLLARAPVFITTLTPVGLIVLMYVLNWLGAVHASVGWQVQALAYSLALGRFLREGLASGGFLKEARTAYQIWQQLDGAARPTFKAPLPSTPVVPGIIQPVGPPPGLRIDPSDAHLSAHRSDRPGIPDGS